MGDGKSMTCMRSGNKKRRERERERERSCDGMRHTTFIYIYIYVLLLVDVVVVVFVVVIMDFMVSRVRKSIKEDVVNRHSRHWLHTLTSAHIHTHADYRCMSKYILHAMMVVGFSYMPVAAFAQCVALRCI